VHYAGLVAGRGVVTVLHQSGLTTEYEPVRASVRAGQRVTAGAVLGAVSGRQITSRFVV
jgi:murein DD-endopeptidase MepM/ murein hydrolase activator NlpD